MSSAHDEGLRQRCSSMEQLKKDVWPPFLDEECVVGQRVFSKGTHNHLRVDLSSSGRVRLAETNCDGLFVEQMAVTHVLKDGRGTNKESALAEDVLSAEFLR